jgi:adenine-specific DNA-methyltransferase
MAKNKIIKESISPIKLKLNELKKIIPECFVENNLDLEMLKKIFKDQIEENDEKYAFTWSGKNETYKLIKTSSVYTLKPVENESVNFKETKNIIIESENLEALKLLQKSYNEKIKMIYIDPPYNTGKDFMYIDDYKDRLKSYLETTGQAKNGIKLTTTPETSGRFHSNWISMMYARLFLARNLLTEDGVIFVSINDVEIHNLIRIMNEIFGEENYIACIVWNSKYTVSNDKKFVSDQHEFIITYAKNIEICDFNLLPRTEESNKSYSNPDNDPRGPWKPTPLHAKSGKNNCVFTFGNGRKWTAPEGRFPRFSIDTLKRLDKENRIWFGRDGKSVPNVKSFLSEVKSGLTPGTLWKWQDVGHTHEANEELAALLGKGIFDNPKPTRLIRRMIQLATEKDNEDIILDFFAGSGTTAHAVFAQNAEDGGNRRFICIQIPESIDKKDYKTITEITKERVKQVAKQIRKDTKQKLDLGFKIFKLTKSNYKIWQDIEHKNSQKLKNQLTLYEFPLIDDYKELDVVYECILKEGLDLNSTVEQISIDKNNVFRVNNETNLVYVMLEKQIDARIIKKLKITKDDILICLDSALSDSQKTNLASQFMLNTI